MEYFVHFEHPFFMIGGVLLLVVSLVIRRLVPRRPVYIYPLATTLYNEGITTRHPYRTIISLLRVVSLIVMIILIGKPQLVDMSSKIKVKGINIMLVLDVSGSMQIQGYADDDRSRFEVAQQEAIRFINSRPNDAIGLVIFGRDAVSRCPLTMDKKMLTSIVQEIKLGDINPDGTVLSRGIVTAANRLKASSAKTNIIIALTDGRPDGDINPDIPVKIAQQLGIKIYTIGIGSDQDTPVQHPMWGIMLIPGVDRSLLTSIASLTGGQFFMARNAQDMRDVYETIDKLEKTEYETPIYNKYEDIFMPFLWILFSFVAAEIILSSLVWFGL